MVEPLLQERFARRCTDAAFGYTAAATAAYATFAEQVFDFWAGVLEPPREKAQAMTVWGWPMLPDASAAAPKPRTSPPFSAPFPFAQMPFALGQFVPPVPFGPFAWPTPRPEASAAFPYAFPFAMFPFALFPFGGGAGAGAGAAPSPFQAWFGMFPVATPAWPMAFMLMASGMPHAVAWPTAEANAAVIDAADVAAASVRRAFSSYRTDGGHCATAVVPSAWPPVQLMALAALLPLTLGTLLTSFRVA
jgi:hypothetical protein